MGRQNVRMVFMYLLLLSLALLPACGGGGGGGGDTRTGDTSGDGSGDIGEIVIPEPPGPPQPALRAIDAGVAFVHTPEGSSLTRSLTLADTTGGDFDWSVPPGHAAWLTVSTGGTMAQPVVLTADPAGLNDGFYQTTVQVASKNPAITGLEKIRAGLYVSRSASVTQLPLFINKIYNVVVDPVRPFMYVTFLDERIDTYHIYTGELIKSYTVDAAVLGNMTVSDDGEVLYAVNAGGRRIERVDLERQTMLAPFTFPDLPPHGSFEFIFKDADYRSVGLNYTRVGAVPCLILNQFASATETLTPVLHAGTGTWIGRVNVFKRFNQFFVVSRDGERIAGMLRGFSGRQRPAIGFLQAAADGSVNGALEETLDNLQPEYAGHDLGISLDGNRVHAAYLAYAGAANRIASFTVDGTRLVPENDLESELDAANIEVTPSGLIVASFAGSIRVYDQNENEIGRADAEFVTAAQERLRVASDSTRIIHINATRVGFSSVPVEQR